ncbi:MYO6 [Symbiodinium sp. CCMP2456]|nr:MYO6 [Symbiodinium sp. CCMP2456]
MSTSADSQKFQVNDLVYVPNPEGREDPFLGGVVVGHAGSEVAVLTCRGSLRCAPAALRRRFESEGCPDNTSLVFLNDASILENLRVRHEVDDIYTYTASVLLAVNPYHDIEGLYGEEQCARYRGKHIGALPPHPYAIADTAYRALVRERRNQGFVISGESGAGKTETAKIVMEYLGYVSGSSNQTTAQIQRRVLQAQPILESFGNAVTMRNNNSSRFGKYNRIFFDESGTLVNASVTTYLLESSRVVSHGKRERTYHCFYEMLSGLSDEELSKLHLDRSEPYLLLTGEAEDLDWNAQFEERDQKHFDRLWFALAEVGFSETDINAIFQVLAGLVHLGDLSDAERDEEDVTAIVELDEEILEKASQLLGLDDDELGTALQRRKVRVKHPGRESITEVPRTTSQFRHALHSLIKALYKRLFERLVQRINSSFRELCPREPSEDAPWCETGILDIYGFERLERNSFEQLCINLANERLQQYFVENVLVAEQAIYRREGLAWQGLALPDSTPVVSAIQQTFRTLDEYSQQLAKGFERMSDEGFCQKTVEDASKDMRRREVLRQLKLSNRRGSGTGLFLNEGFLVKHYAGWVEYTTKGWLDKNNDRLLPECEELICDSTFPFVASLGEEDPGKVPFRSISKKYCTDLESLLETLNTCQLHYIRCFKPNDFQEPGIFDQGLVLDQIIQCGTIELVRIMHDGYPNRCHFEEIVGRFRSLLPESFQRYGMRTFIEALMLAYDVPNEDWELGVSRLFLKAGRLKALEDLRSEGAVPDPEALRRIVQGIIRKRWIRAIHAVQLCHYLPKLLEEIRAARASAALATTALLVGRLQPLLTTARERLLQRRLRARRRLRAATLAVRLTLKVMAEVRLQRMQKAMRRWWLLRSRLDTWLREKAEALLEEEEERQRLQEEERLRAEEERRRAEEEELRREQEERERAEEAERQRVEEEAEEERRRAYEEELRRAEELHMAKQEEEREREREVQRQRKEAELRHQHELARRHDEEERDQQEELNLREQPQGHVWFVSAMQGVTHCSTETMAPHGASTSSSHLREELRFEAEPADRPAAHQEHDEHDQTSSASAEEVLDESEPEICSRADPEVYRNRLDEPEAEEQEADEEEEEEEEQEEGEEEEEEDEDHREELEEELEPEEEQRDRSETHEAQPREDHPRFSDTKHAEEEQRNSIMEVASPCRSSGSRLPEPLPEHAQEFHSPAASRALEAKMAVLSEEMNSRGAAHQRQLQALLEETTRLQEQIQAPASASPGLQGTPQRSHRLSGTPEASGSRKRAPKTPSRRDLVLTDSWESREATRKMMYSDLYPEDFAVNMQRRTTPKKPQADCQREQTVSTFRRSLAESDENDSSPRQHMQCSREWWHQQRQMLIQDIERERAETDFL